MRLVDDLLDSDATTSQNTPASFVPDLRNLVPDYCAGCPHIASYHAIKVVERRLGRLEVEVHGDLACPLKESSELVPSSLFRYTIRDRRYPKLVVIARPSFLHSKEAGDLVSDLQKQGGTLLVLDNELIGVMRRKKEIATILDVVSVNIVSPFDIERLANTIINSLPKGSLSVILAHQPCHVREARNGTINRSVSTRRYQMDESCTGCKHCMLQIGCPALEAFGHVVRVDYSLCVGCGVCASVCPNGSIREAEP